MNWREHFDGLDEVYDDPLLRRDETLRTEADQAWVDGDRIEYYLLTAKHTAWQCAILRAWWSL
jgi:hypothetical protein